MTHVQTKSIQNDTYILWATRTTAWTRQTFETKIAQLAFRNARATEKRGRGGLFLRKNGNSFQSFQSNPIQTLAVHLVTFGYPRWNISWPS